MLRRGILIACLVVLTTAVAGAVAGWHTLPLAILPSLLILGLLIERHVYKPIGAEPPGAGWERTQEQFIDPRSGQSVAVYFNARTGERRYVAQDRR